MSGRIFQANPPEHHSFRELINKFEEAHILQVLTWLKPITGYQMQYNVTVARRGAWGGSPAERPEGGSPSEGPGVVVPASPWVTAAAAVGSGVPWGGPGR